MKILIANDGPTAFWYIRQGLAKAFSTKHEVIIWDIHKKNAYDAFDEFEPDIFLGQTYNTTDTLCKIIEERPHLKVIMKGADWGKLSDEIPEEFGVLKSTEEERDRILRLYELTGQPTYIHIYYHPDYIEQTHGYWKDAGIPIRSHILAADIFDYTNGTKRKEFDSDITFIGGYWPYKAQNINKYLLSLCNTYDYRIKIFGNAHWPVAQYCGSAPQSIVRDILKSATICPQIHEPHSTEYGFDMSERTFKLLANKCFCISDYVEGLNKLFGDDLVMAKTPQDFKEKIDYFLNNKDKRYHYIDRGYNAVMNEHTYFHRVRDIFNNLRFENAADEIMEIYKTLRSAVDEGNII